MKRLLFAAGLACCLSLTTEAAEPNWQEYSYPEAGFSANFPEPPKSVSSLRPTMLAPAGGVKEQVYSFDEGGVVYSVGIVDFRNSGADPDAAVREARDALVGDGRLESETSLEIDLVHGSQFIVIGSDGTRYTDGIFYFKEQLYQVKVVYPVGNNDPAGSSGVSFFLNHFRFLDPF